MLTLVATVAGVVVALTLLGSAVAHAARPAALVAALADQGVLPTAPPTAPPARVTARMTAAVVVAAEAVLGVAVVVDRTVGLAGAAVLFAGYAAYTGYLHRTRTSEVPCGCGDGVAVSGWVVGRAGALAAVALLGLVARPMDAIVSAEAAVAGCAGVTFACLLWQLPAAMTVGGRPA